MYETIERRFSPKNIAAWGLPKLVLIDGGKGQLQAALRAMRSRSVTVPTISIAKREEEILIHKTDSHIPLDRLQAMMANPPQGVGVYDEREYIIVNLHVGQVNAGAHSRNLRGGQSVSPYGDVTRLFQRVRDESHRFAVSYHTVLKRKKQTAGVLDEIPGVGPVTKKKLLKAFGSVKGITQASDTELRTVVGQSVIDMLRKYINNS